MTEQQLADEKRDRLTCPMHGSDQIYLYEDPDDVSTVLCPGLSCDYTFQNVLKYPVVEVRNMKTGTTRLVNYLTGEPVAS